MAKDYLIAYVHSRAELESKKMAENVVNAILETFIESLSENGHVGIRHFGSFSVQERAARVGRNPRTGEEIRIPAGRTVKFVPGTDLKNAAQAVMDGKGESWLESQQFMRKSAEHLDKLRRKITELSNKPANLRKEAEGSYNETVQSLADLYENARYQFTLLRGSTYDAWGDVRQGFEAAYEDLKKGFSKASGHF